MREADYDKAFNVLEAKKEFDKKREASFLGFGAECAGATDSTLLRRIYMCAYICV